MVGHELRGWYAQLLGTRMTEGLVTFGQGAQCRRRKRRGLFLTSLTIDGRPGPNIMQQRIFDWCLRCQPPIGQHDAAFDIAVALVHVRHAQPHRQAVESHADHGLDRGCRRCQAQMLSSPKLLWLSGAMLQPCLNRRGVVEIANGIESVFNGKQSTLIIVGPQVILQQLNNGPVHVFQCLIAEKLEDTACRTVAD